MAKCESSELDTVAVVLDEDSREIVLFGDIDAEIAAQVVTGLRQLDRASKANITMIINSGGGEVTAGYAIYDAMCLTRSKIVGQCYGGCMSIATLILQACDTRLLAPNCRVMIHNGSAGYSGPLEKINAAIKEENLLTQLYYEKLAERSELTVDQVKDLCDHESYMDANVAVGYGFADGILGQTKKRKGKK
jgi:ATP-dependent Clp protease protease subunit